MVMIGDGPQDVNCGKAVGARTVGVSYGIKGVAEVAAAGPDVLIDSVDGIWAFLAEHPGASGEKLAASGGISAGG
jgi:phosphoglycolate phosphatase